MVRYYPADRATLDSKAPANNPILTGDPTAPTPSAGDHDNSIATTGFVRSEIDAAVVALPVPPSRFKNSCQVATTENITLADEQIIDGRMTSGSRVLVKNQTDKTKNGLWLSKVGPWVRVDDTDEAAETLSGMLVFIENGTANGGQLFFCATKGTIVLGTTELDFERVIQPDVFYTGKVIDTALYSLVPLDNNKRLEFTHAGEKTVLMEQSLLDNVPVDTSFRLINLGSGKLIINLGPGIQFRSFSDIVTLRQYEEATLVKRAMPNDWILTGFYGGRNYWGSQDPNIPDDPLTPPGSVIVDAERPASPTGLIVTSSIVQLENGQQIVRMVATCDSNAEADGVVGYIFEVKESDGNFVGFSTNTTYYHWDVKPAVTYTIRAIAFDAAGNKSLPSDPPVVHVAAKDTIPPGIPDLPEISVGLDSMWAVWKNPSDNDLSHIEVYSNTVNDPNTSTLIDTVLGESFVITGLPIGTTRYFWMRAVDTSGNQSDFSDVIFGTTGAIPEDDKFVFDGVTFKQNDGATNRLSWTAGEISYGPLGVDPTVKSIAAGFVNWTAGKVYVYYIRGDTKLLATTLLTSVYAANGVVMGVYKGGTDFSLIEGNAYVDGAMILAQTIGASQLVTNQAVITGTAQIADAIISNAKIIEISAAKLMAGTALAGSITVSGRSIGSLSNVDVLVDDMTQDWTVYSNGSPASTVSFTTHVNSVVTGSRSILVSPGDEIWMEGPDLIPFDPSKLYKLTFRIRRNTGTEGNLYLGFNGFAGDKITRVNTAGADSGSASHYVVLNAVAQSTIPTTFTEYSAYVRGHSAAGGTGSGTIASPRTAHTNVRYIRPMALFNYRDTAGSQMVLDSVKMEVVNEDAAAIVNAGTTQIDPGKILISGSTTLASWRNGGDNTLIEGGKLAANTVTANKLEIGARGISIEGIRFTYNKATNNVSWTAGVIRYTRADGTSAGDPDGYVNVSANSSGVTWSSGTVFIYWNKGAADPANGATVALSSSTSASVANGTNTLVLATYKGGTNFIANYGQTIIDGSTIYTGTVATAQLAAEAVTTDKLAAQVITASKMYIGDTSNIYPDFDMVDDAFYQTPASSYPADYSISSTSVSYNGRRQIGISLGAAQQEVHSGLFSLNQSADYYFEGVLRGDPGIVMINLYSTNGFSEVYTRTITLITGNVSGKQSAAFTTTSSETKGKLIFRRNAGGTTTTWFSAPIIRRKASGELIVDGSIEGKHIKAETVTSDKMAANSITAKHMVLADSTNIIPDNGLQDIDSWSVGGLGPPYITTHSVGGKAWRFTANGTPSSTTNYIASVNSKRFSVIPGEQIRFGGTIDMDTSSATQQMRFYMYFYDAAGTQLSAASITAASTTAAQTIGGNVTVPANATEGMFVVRRGSAANGTASGGSAWAWGLFAYRRMDADLIVDGSIEAIKIKAGTITADRLILNGITTDRIANSAITNAAGARTAAAISCTAGADTQIQSVVVTGDANAFAQIIGSFLVNPLEKGNNFNSQYISVAIKVFRGATLIHTINTRLAVTGFEWGYYQVSYVEKLYFGGIQPVIVKDDDPAAGSNTYAIKINPAETISVSERNLFAAVVKK